MASSSPGGSGITRRGFLLGAATGLAAGAGVGWTGAHWLNRGSEENAPDPPRTIQYPDYPLPGPFPGRVIEVRRPGVLRADHTPDPELVQQMVDRGLVALVEGDRSDPVSAWKHFFNADDVVGIKVNPVGRAPKAGEAGRVPGAQGCISSPALVVAVVEGLKKAGVKPRNIILFERYAEEFIDAGYADLMRSRPLDGCRWLASAARYHPAQVDIAGFDEDRSNFSPEFCDHVVGYDPDVFTTMGFASPAHDPRDDRRFRTHLSLIVSRLVSKVITLPCLKDHRSAGVTIALKNLSHGMNNNVARSHVSGIVQGVHEREGTILGPNQCNTFIPQAVAQPALRRKATLHIVDGLIGVYEGGPGNWNKSWGTWPYEGLLFGTDPVALDHVGWTILDAKRQQMGLRPVAETGLFNHHSPQVQTASELAVLAGRMPLDATLLESAVNHVRAGRASEVFDLRTPQHVILAGYLGLGVFERAGIDHRRFELTR